MIYEYENASHIQNLNLLVQIQISMLPYANIGFSLFSVLVVVLSHSKR
jgi:hypothetical protein